MTMNETLPLAKLLLSLDGSLNGRDEVVFVVSIFVVGIDGAAPRWMDGFILLN